MSAPSVPTATTAPAAPSGAATTAGSRAAGDAGAFGALLAGQTATGQGGKATSGRVASAAEKFAPSDEAAAPADSPSVDAAGLGLINGAVLFIMPASQNTNTTSSGDGSAAARSAAPGSTGAATPGTAAANDQTLAPAKEGKVETANAEILNADKKAAEAMDAALAKIATPAPPAASALLAATARMTRVAEARLLLKTPSEDAASPPIGSDGVPLEAAPGEPPVSNASAIREEFASRAGRGHDRETSAGPAAGSPASTGDPSAESASASLASATADKPPSPARPAIEVAPQPPAAQATSSDAVPITATPAALPGSGANALAPGLSAAAATSLSTLSHAAIEATTQIAAQVSRRLEGKSTRFQMALAPDDLGRVDVSLDIDADGQLTARLAFDNPAAAADLRGRVDDLRRQLEDAGFTVSRDGLQFADRDSSSGGFGRRQDRASPYGDRAATAPEIAEAAWIPLSLTRSSLTPTGVDVKV